MHFRKPLLEGVFLKRYKRFFADIELQGTTEIAHVANTGSLKGCNIPGSACLVSQAENPERKLKFSLEALKSPNGTWVGVNTSHPNQLVKEAFYNSVVPHWKDYEELQSEVSFNSKTRIDFVLKKGLRKHFIEVKNVSFAEKQADKIVAKFPDSVTERGQRHLKELIALVKKGNSAEIFFTVQRSDCNYFSPADEIDPEYGRLLREAAQMGVRISAYVVKMTPVEIQLMNKKLRIVW